MNFKLISPYRPTGDQPEAIRQLVDGVNMGIPYQTLLGVTGSGKTFTIANVVEQVQKPTLVLSHNKTLAAQLYSEFKSFFPQNAVDLGMLGKTGIKAFFMLHHLTYIISKILITAQFKSE